MEIVMGERIVSFESTLALGAAIALGLYNQNRAAQRAVRQTHGTGHLRLFRVTHQTALVHTGLGNEASGLGSREHRRSQPAGLGSEASSVGAR